MLSRLRIQNFRLLRDVEVDFEEDAPTVFIGPNGCGKSTILEALHFLSWCSSDGLQAAVAAHGGAHAVRTIGAEGPIVFEMTWDWRRVGDPLERDARSLHWKIHLQPEITGALAVQLEELTELGVERPKPLVTTGKTGGRSALAEGVANSKPSRIGSTTKLAFEELFDADRFPGLTLLSGLLAAVNVVGPISTVPAWLRADRASPSPRDSLVIAPALALGPQGIGLANVLFGLFNNHREAWEELERAFRAEFPFVRRLVFPPDIGGGRIAFALEDERFPGRKLFASEMSDGMIAYLCLLASVLQPEQASVLALDEPDANLHPSALRRLMGLAHRKRETRRLAIVTHSNALIDELREPEKSIRVVDSTRTGARIRKLDAEALGAWRKEYGLSDLRRTGLLDPSNSAYGTDE